MEKQGEIILYQPDEAVRLEVRLEDETVWLTQAQIAELFQRDRTVITKHINNVFKEKELEEKSNVHFLHIAFSLQFPFSKNIIYMSCNYCSVHIKKFCHLSLRKPYCIIFNWYSKTYFTILRFKNNYII